LLDATTLEANYLRLRLHPDVTIAMGMMVMTPSEDLSAKTVEMQASSFLRAAGMDAYERLLGCAMAGDTSMFAREDYVEEAWGIVEPVLKAGTPVYEYEPNTWGPGEAERVAPPGGWSNPTVGREKVAAAA
jgi:glucose-6-phosphate 1-dehydrogenase